MANVFSSYAEVKAYLTILPRGVSLCGLIVGVVLVLLIFFGNIFIVWTVYRDKRLRTRANVFLVSMAVAEILMMLARDVPILMAYTKGRWELGPSWLLANFILDKERNVVAVMHVLIITVYRYVMIVFNKYYHYISRVAVVAVLLVLVYVLPLVVMIVTSRDLFFTDVDLDLYLFLNTKTMRMWTLHELPRFQISQNVTGNATDPESNSGAQKSTTVILFFGIAALVLVALYLHIYLFLRKHTKKQNTWAAQRPQAPGVRSKNHDVKFIKTMAIVFLAYVFSYFWIPIIAIVDKYGTIPHAVYLPFVLLNWSNSCMNWVIYALSNVYFRQSLVRIFKGKSHNTVGATSDQGTSQSGIAAVTSVTEC